MYAVFTKPISTSNLIIPTILEEEYSVLYYVIFSITLLGKDIIFNTSLTTLISEKNLACVRF
jgi:hypothetical protein